MLMVTVNMSDSSSESKDEDNGPSKEECIAKFKEMLKERGVAPFSKWEKELPKIVFDPRFKFLSWPSQVNRQGGPCLNTMLRHVLRRNVRKNEQLKAAIEGFKQLLLRSIRGY
ncbi:hypothetical protein Patl1_07208 [Pistacia atlantica]|uniref:Uncharacterized protein n=1 Tax=Pistacia atlantica TaxID=434234 RepID=A0ACC1AH09_9ROSI|nr:hypothetical protein Patl1_07208 [Pistacia atlantica]